MKVFHSHEEAYRMFRSVVALKHTMTDTEREACGVHLDTNPAPGYSVPRVTGQPRYQPNYNGSRISVFYSASHPPTERAIEEASRAVRLGMDRKELHGRIVDMRRLNEDDGLQILIAAENRTDMEIPNGIPLRSLIIYPSGVKKGGVIGHCVLDGGTGGIPTSYAENSIRDEKEKRGDK